MHNLHDLVEKAHNAALQNQIDPLRHDLLQQLHAHTGRDTLIIAGDSNASDHATLDDRELPGLMIALDGLKGKELDLILHSQGGLIKTAEEIVRHLRSRYSHVRAIIPQNAMSAATMIACSANVIVMGEQSALGPTDPQLPGGISTLDVIMEFEQGKQDAMNSQGAQYLWGLRIQSWPPGLLERCFQAMTLSRELVLTWLSTYMFSEMRQKDPVAANSKAAEIADWLANSSSEHRTHGRPLGIEVLRAKGMNVEELGKDPKMENLVRAVLLTTLATFQLTSCSKLVENHLGKGIYTLPKSEPILRQNQSVGGQQPAPPTQTP